MGCIAYAACYPPLGWQTCSHMKTTSLKFHCKQYDQLDDGWSQQAAALRGMIPELGYLSTYSKILLLTQQQFHAWLLTYLLDSWSYPFLPVTCLLDLWYSTSPLIHAFLPLSISQLQGFFPFLDGLSFPSFYSSFTLADLQIGLKRCSVAPLYLQKSYQKNQGLRVFSSFLLHKGAMWHIHSNFSRWLEDHQSQS